MAKARYYLLTGEMVTGAEAERIGLVSKALPAGEGACRCAARRGWPRAGSQPAIRLTKRALNGWLRMAGPIFDRSAAYEMLTFMGDDVIEGTAALREKRAPGSPPRRLPRPDAGHRSARPAGRCSVLLVLFQERVHVGLVHAREAAPGQRGQDVRVGARGRPGKAFPARCQPGRRPLAALAVRARRGDPLDGLPAPEPPRVLERHAQRDREIALRPGVYEGDAPVRARRRVGVLVERAEPVRRGEHLAP